MGNTILDGLFVQIVQKIVNNLLTGQEQAEIKGKHFGLNRLPQPSPELQLRIVREQKKVIQDILEKTQTEFTKGCEIIKNR